MMVKEQAVVQPFLKIHPDDNVLVALTDLRAGTPVSFGKEEIIIAQDIPSKHKFFIRDLKAGDEVIMYGALVGKIQSDVPKGGLMTTDNTKHAAGHYSYRGFRTNWQQPDASKFLKRTFNGYRRSDGRVGTANYWLFIPMV